MFHPLLQNLVGDVAIVHHVTRGFCVVVAQQSQALVLVEFGLDDIWAFIHEVVQLVLVCLSEPGQVFTVIDVLVTDGKTDIQQYLVNEGFVNRDA
jgi:hypothetical protein